MKSGVAAVECASVILKLVASNGGAEEEPNGQVYTVGPSSNVLVCPALHTYSLVGLGLFRLTDKRQGFLA